MSTMLAPYGLGAAATTSLWSDCNQVAAKALSPVKGALDTVLKTAGVAAADRTKITTRPLDAMLDIFDPIEDAVGRAVDRVMKSRGATQTFFGTKINLTRVQAVDKRGDVSTQNLLKSLRTMQAFIVLLWTQPDGLIYEMAREGLDIANDAGKLVTSTAASAASAISKEAGKAVKAITDAAQAAADAAKNFFGLGAVGSLGEPVTAVAATAATGAAATAGAALETGIMAAITAIIGALMGGATKVVTDMISGDGDDDDDDAPAASTSMTTSPYANQILRPTTSTVVVPTSSGASNNTALYVGLGAGAIALALFMSRR